MKLAGFFGVVNFLNNIDIQAKCFVYLTDSKVPGIVWNDMSSLMYELRPCSIFVARDHKPKRSHPASTTLEAGPRSLQTCHQFQDVHLYYSTNERRLENNKDLNCREHRDHRDFEYQPSHSIIKLYIFRFAVHKMLSSCMPASVGYLNENIITPRKVQK